MTNISQVSIVAHRGASAYCPGNTLGAFQLASEQGAEYVECDIRLTKDDQLVVWHDWKVMVDGVSIAIRDLELVDLRKVLANELVTKWGEIPREHILILPEFLHWLQSTKMGAIIEIKSNPVSYTLLPLMVANAVQESGMLERCYLVSFDHVAVQRIKARLPEVKTGILYVARLANLHDTIRLTKASLMETPNDYLDFELITTAHAAGCQVCGWSTDDCTVIAGLVALGVDMITTESPDLARSCINSLDTDSTM